MRDFDLDAPVQRPPVRDQDTAPAAAGRPIAPGGSPAMGAESIMHLQRTVGNQGVLQLLSAEEEAASPVHDVVGSGGGSPLDEQTRSTMESAFGASFDGVRVHTDAQASRSAESVGANAYTVGSDIVFRSGQFDPSSAAGQRTLAHELSHVVQQSQGPVDGTEAPGGIRVSDPSDRFERAADRTADQVMGSVQAGGPRQSSRGGSGRTAQLLEDETAASVQRQRDMEEEEELQA